MAMVEQVDITPQRSFEMIPKTGVVIFFVAAGLATFTTKGLITGAGLSGVDLIGPGLITGAVGATNRGDSMVVELTPMELADC